MRSPPESVKHELSGLITEFFPQASPLLDGEEPLTHTTGWSSLRFLSMLSAAEERFAVKFRASEITALRAWPDFIRLVVSKR